ncbi:hypothetical protein BH09VER1_BH09VER1_54890 [soil metagenome]
MRLAVAWAVLLASVSAQAVASTVDKTLKYEGVGFHVVIADNVVSIVPSGLKNNAGVAVKIRGKATGTKVEDLDADGDPEIYIFIRGPGIEARGRVLAYATNRRKSLIPIDVPELTDSQAKGYRGHDEYAVVEGNFLRRFRIPGGKVRQIQYKLRRDKTGSVLSARETVEF